jgi:hypothetical protein
MPSTTTDRSLRDRLTGQHNVSIATAILFALPAAFAFYNWSSGRQGSFLLLLLLGVSVPTLYDDGWGRYDRTWQTVVWTVTACAVVGVEFVGLYVLGLDALSLSTFGAGVGAFLVTTLLNLCWVTLLRA